MIDVFSMVRSPHLIIMYNVMLLLPWCAGFVIFLFVGFLNARKTHSIVVSAIFMSNDFN
jgi:hypothetical protein